MHVTVVAIHLEETSPLEDVAEADELQISRRL